ncbi:glycosyltransferase family 2 protein [Hyphococcus sp.]|jgi:hypothetical protein|uniref:glycosyltransferase family 2 protein n=1 Tax=Hyphococcus sp. TaxID=2038636 RepID=UPI003D10A925
MQTGARLEQTGNEAQAEDAAGANSLPALQKPEPRKLSRAARVAHLPWLMYGVYLFIAATVMYLVGVLLVFPRYLFGLNETLLPVSEFLVWYSGVPMVLGLAFAAADFFLFFESKRPVRRYREESMRDVKVTVALTAYNDEDSIAAAVENFLSHERVEQVIVVSNNSTDKTFERAEAAGAIVVNEERQGYGRCVYRCYIEAMKRSTSDLIVLCEGDRTFRAADIDKLVTFAPHTDIVNGTRTVETLREQKTQLTTFMFYGNLFVAKLMEAKHLGRATLTDVGSTYKLVRRRALARLLPHLNPEVNLEFNAYFMDKALEAGLTLIECPVTFHPRVGVSKGGNTDNIRALQVGLRMIRGITFGWKKSS